MKYSVVPSSTEVNCCATPPTEVSGLPPRTLTVLPRVQNLRSEGSSISYPLVHVGGLVTDDFSEETTALPKNEDQDEEDAYILPIKNWIQRKKVEYKNTYLLGRKNSSNNLVDYKNKLEKLGNTLLHAFEKDPFDETILEANGWPKELIECMKDSAVSTPVLYSIQTSFIEFPHSESTDYVENVLKPENENQSLE